ncbi:DNA-binding response regulator [Sphingomonas paeninsulae]|jgi:two-component system KDP operon response regulator KdpE|uniref:DNA-binding response regulator n=1 Tax=Sphingomonas paeninsulae TaxID=2319844 RepID=A0A494THJ4_SPHPE|nr:response regulator transcription factor [Sphingomonas paeninsulae]AYJ86792.1 DNA-binding response regulator [Sphingomonas paeninsulae]
MSNRHILIVDDEPSLLAVLEPVLCAAGYRVTTAINGRAALVADDTYAPDLILLDLGLPDLDGKKIIQRLRLRRDVPIIVISARHQESEKIAALDEGADDYVDKPFEIGELMARIRASFRRRSAMNAETNNYQAGPLAIDYASSLVTIDGQTVKLSPKEHDLLVTLARSAGQVVTHKRLLAAGWPDGTADTQYLRVYIGLLRQKIEEDPGDPRLILTEPGVGYRLLGGSVPDRLRCRTD